MTLFKNIYRIVSTRLRGWDYSAAGYYFVTLCTKNRHNFFGDVVNGEMILIPIGDIVGREWIKTATIRPNVRMDEWIIMLDHIHGIIVIHDPVETPRHVVVETPRRGVSTTWKPNSLGSIINQIKSICTKRIWESGYSDFRWQSRFYDCILRNELSLQKARHYIQDNPLNWELDKKRSSDIFM
jgi:REP element-mobilizing transposase RayT